MATRKTSKDKLLLPPTVYDLFGKQILTSGDNKTMQDNRIYHIGSGETIIDFFVIGRNDEEKIKLIPDVSKYGRGEKNEQY